MVKNVLLFVTSLYFSFASCAQSNTEYTQWIKKANALYESKQYKQSAEAFSHAFAALGGKGYPDDRYNAACSWALAGNSDSAFFHLERLAAKANYKDHNHLTTDSDLESLHRDNRWQPICDLVKQNKEKSEANFNKPLVAILDTIRQNDQQYRMQIRDVESKFGGDSKEMKALWDTINYYDSVDLIKVLSILEQYGWPGPDMVGSTGSQTVFLVIQHADIITQDKYLPVMREAVKNKKAYPSDLALLEDRVNLRHGRKQIYGSQVSSDADGLFNGKLEDPDNVDKRRAEVGLNPLAEYLEYFSVRWDLKEYKKKHPATGKQK